MRWLTLAPLLALAMPARAQNGIPDLSVTAAAPLLPLNDTTVQQALQGNPPRIYDPHLFRHAADAWLAPLNAATDAVTHNILSDNALPIGTAVVLTVIVFAAEMMYRRAQWNEFALLLLRVGLILTFLRPDFYFENVNSLKHTVPDAISAAVSGAPMTGGGGFDIYDMQRNKIYQQTAIGFSQATGVSHVGDRVALHIASGVASAAVWVVFVLHLLSIAALSLVFTLVPFGILALLWKATAQFGAAVFGQCVGYFCMVMLLSIILAVGGKLNMSYLVAATGFSANEIEVVSSLWAFCFYIGLTAVFALAVPGIAARLSGGIVIDWASYGAMAASRSMGVMGRLGRTGSVRRR